MREILYKNFGDDQTAYQDLEQTERRFRDLLNDACDISKAELARNLIRDSVKFGKTAGIDVAIQWQDGNVIVDLFLPYRTYSSRATELLHLLLFAADSFSLDDGTDLDSDVAMQLFCSTTES